MDSSRQAISNAGDRVFSKEEAQRVVTELASYIGPDEPLHILVSNWWGASQRWARNRASLTSDQREVYINIKRGIRYYNIHASTNQLDSVSLKGIADHVEYYAKRSKSKRPPDMPIEVPHSDAKGANVWSDATFNRSVAENASVVEELTRLSEKENFMSSGYIETTGATALKYVRDNWGRVESEWGTVTQAQCSATVRHPKGASSGWAGKTSFDIKTMDIAGLARLAFDRCKKSLNPVRIEPGRYQVILEPQATAALAGLFVGALSRKAPEEFGMGPAFLGVDQAIGRFRSKLGLKIVDERLNLFHDPVDPVVGSHVAPLHGRREFINKGILTGLYHDYKRNLNEVSDMAPIYFTSSYTLNGGNTTMEDMISSTKRGFLVSRFSNVHIVDRLSVLAGGLTRDGLWLIENGVITKAVRNFRWTESPFFAFNNVEQIGIEEPVHDPVLGRSPLSGASFALSLNNVVVPPLKINDFSFTSTIDAI